jgi:O-antigen ligase
MKFRTLTLVSLLCYLASLAATQTAYGGPFLPIRWISLASFSFFGALSWLANDRRLPLGELAFRVVVYLFLWSLTAINGVYPQFSTYRLIAHALVVVSCLILLPQAIQFSDGARLLHILKVLIATTLIISWLSPAPLTAFDSANQFRGIFGNSNSLGHMAAIGCLLFMHGVLTKSGSRSAQIQLVLAAFSAILLIRSGARSSSVALLAGLIALFVVKKELNARNMLIGWGIVISGLIITLTLQSRVEGFIFKRLSNESVESRTSSLTISRLPTWSASWEGFKERPILGWGFGVDSDTDLSNWHGQFTAVGFTGRDALNDLTFTLETGGIVGCIAYFFMLTIALRMWIPPIQLAWFASGLRQSELAITKSALQAQQAFACLNLLLIVLFELDDTALSAGSFPSVLLWTSLGISTALRTLLLHELPRRLLATYTGSSFLVSANEEAH